MPAIARKSQIPVIADIHFQPKYVFAAIDAGCAGVRVNPGNIRKFDDKVAEIARAAPDAGVPIRIGVNAGSLDPRLLAKYGKATPEALVESALWEASLFEEHGFHDFKISVKHHDPVVMVRAYELLAERCDCPLHLGVTEAGPAFQGTIKSAVAFGALLSRGSATPSGCRCRRLRSRRSRSGSQILQSLNLRERKLEIVSCPSCGRAQVDVYTLAEQVTAGLEGMEVPLRVAVMGCVVNGPGEAREADLGVASGNGKGQIFVKGEVIKTVPEAQIVETLIEEAMRIASELEAAGVGVWSPSGVRQLTGAANGCAEDDDRALCGCVATGRPAGGARAAGAATRCPTSSCAVSSALVRTAPTGLGGELWGFARPGSWSQLCYFGANLVPVEQRRRRPPVALPAWRPAGTADAARRYSGRPTPVLTMWDLLRRTGIRRGRCDQTSRCSPCADRPRIPADPLVRRVWPHEIDTVLPACIAMFTEEVGVSPVGRDGGAHYRARVAELVTSGRAFARFEDGEVVFKAEIGAATPDACQVQGVWVRPDRRGEGLCAPGMAAVVEHALARIAPVVTLYVNDYNLPARSAYRRVGFRRDRGVRDSAVLTAASNLW